MRLQSVVACGVVVVTGATRDARACSLPGPEPFVVDGTPTAAPPQPPRDLAYTVTRGRGVRDGASTSCDDLGIVKLTLTPPSGDVGFVVEQIGGTLPDGVSLAATPVRQAGLQIVWIDGATDAQERLDFTLRLASVDRSGRQSGWSAPLRITDAGSGADASTGCALVEGGASGGAGAGSLALAALALVRRRRGSSRRASLRASTRGTR